MASLLAERSNKKHWK